MGSLIKFLLDLILPFVFVGVGWLLLKTSFENESGLFFYAGGALILIGVLRFVWMAFVNGVSLFGD